MGIGYVLRRGFDLPPLMFTLEEAKALALGVSMVQAWGDAELQKAAQEAAEKGEKPQQMSEAELAELRQQQEQDQAMEQWLRRIPDDPGGLLRRKFRHQYQRSGVDQDGNSVWPDNEVQPW